MIRWINRQARIWWPAAAAVVGGAILATLGFVVTTVIDGRSEDRERNEQLAELVEQQADIIERDRRRDAGAEQRLQGAIREVEALLADQFAEHDLNVALKLNDLLAQIAALLDRPAGTPPQPVTTITPHAPSPPAPSPPGRRATNEPEPTTTTTTTRPDQRRCVADAGHPRC